MQENEQIIVLELEKDLCLDAVGDLLNLLQYLNTDGLSGLDRYSSLMFLSEQLISGVSSKLFDYRKLKDVEQKAFSLASENADLIKERDSLKKQLRALQDASNSL